MARACWLGKNARALLNIVVNVHLHAPPHKEFLDTMICHGGAGVAIDGAGMERTYELSGVDRCWPLYHRRRLPDVGRDPSP